MKLLFISISILVVASAFCQSAGEFYIKEESLYKNRDYQGSANLYSIGIRMDPDPLTGRFWNAACSWSLLWNTDSAFHYLKYLETSDKVNPVTILGIEEGRKPMTFIIDEKSKYLKGDGKGPYKNNEEKIASYFLTAYNFLTSGIQVLEESADWSDTSSRYFIVNLNTPIRGSGAKRQGEIRDPFASFHAFYKIDTSAKLDLIYNLNQMPVGTTIESPRTDFIYI